MDFLPPSITSFIWPSHVPAGHGAERRSCGFEQSFFQPKSSAQGPRTHLINRSRRYFHGTSWVSRKPAVIQAEYGADWKSAMALAAVSAQLSSGERMQAFGWSHFSRSQAICLGVKQRS